MSREHDSMGHASGAQARDMIDGLTRQLLPVRPVQLSRVFGGFLAAEVVAAAVAVWAVGLRPDIAARVGEPAFLLVVALLAVAAAGCAVAAVRSAIPGRFVGRALESWMLATPLVLAALVLVAHPWEGHWHGWAMFLSGCWKCTAVTAASAVTPWLVAVLVLRRLAPLIAMRVAMFAGFSAFFIGALVTQLHCPVGSSVHLAFAHFLPVTLLSAAVCGATAALLRQG